MNNLKRTLAFILITVLAFSLVPAAGVRAEENDAIFIESDDTTAKEEVSADEMLPEKAAPEEEESQIPAFVAEGDSEETEWSIGVNYIFTDDLDYEDFGDFQNTVIAGEWLQIGSIVLKNGEYYTEEIYESETIYDEEIDEYYGQRTGYKDGYHIEYTLVPKQEGEPEIKLPDYLGSCSLTAYYVGDFTFRMSLYYEGKVAASCERDLTVIPRPGMPTDFRVAFEINNSYADRFESSEIDTYYIDSDDSYINCYPALYVEGKKVLREYESSEGAYFSSKWIASSNEDVISFQDYGSWSNETVNGSGEAVITAAIYYAADRNSEPVFLTAATLKVVVTEYEIKTKENRYSRCTMYIVGEEAVIKPEVYTDVYDSSIGEWGDWVVTPEDPADIEFVYDSPNLSPDQYEISGDTQTLTIPAVPEGQYDITITAVRNGSILVQTTVSVIGSYPPESMGLTIRSSDNTKLKNTVYTFHNFSAGYVFATAVGFEWGETHFEFLDPKTNEPISGMEEHKISGGSCPSCILAPAKTGDILIRATLYRELDGSKIVSEDILLHVKAPTVTVKDQTYTGKSLTPSPTVKIGSTTLKKGTDYTVKYKTNKNVGTATVIITGKGNYKGTIKKTFKINPKGTSISKLTPGSKKITVKWKKQSAQTSGYEIQCSLKKDFKKIASKKTVAGASNTSGVLSGLTKGKSYYVRIRTYKKVGSTKYYSAWKIYSKTVKAK